MFRESACLTLTDNLSWKVRNEAQRAFEEWSHLHDAAQLSEEAAWRAENRLSVVKDEACVAEHAAWVAEDMARVAQADAH